MYNKISTFIDELSSQYLGVWQDVCNIESPTSSKEGVDKVGQYFVGLAKAMGFATEVCPQEVAGDAICITMNPEATGKSVAFSAHMDTVHPIGSFGYPPVKIEGDYIYGPGVVDCKGGAVASLLAMAAMQKAGFGGKVMLILQSDEEVGSSISQHKTIHYMCEKAKDCVAFLNCEGEKTDQKDVLVLHRKGILRYTFEVKGIAAHASKCFKKGKSAILEAAHKIIELEKVKEPEGLTFCCGTIEGGSAANTVPETCSFTVDIRYVSAKDRARAIEMLERVANTSYTGETTCTLTKTSERIAMEMADRNIALLQKMNDIYARLGMTTYNIGGSLGGSDAAYTTSANIPTVDSIGIKGYAIHTLQERGYIPSLVASAKRLAMAAYGLITE